MAKLIAFAAVLVSLGCGRGSSDIAQVERRPTAVGGCVDCGCANIPTECGTRFCVDCTAHMPPHTDAVCLAPGVCDYPCTEGFHGCGGECVPDSSVLTCGTSCAPCEPPPNGIPLCAASGRCDFNCSPGFVRSGAGCASLSFSISY